MVTVDSPFHEDVIIITIIIMWMFNKGNCTIAVANGTVAVMTESQVTANSKDTIWSLIGKITQNYIFSSLQERTGPSSLRGRLKMGDDHRYQVLARATMSSLKCSDC